MTVVRHLPICCPLLVIVVAAGCWSSDTKPSGRVEGQVSYKGQPVAEGNVNFHSKATGVAAMAKLNGGKFSLAQPLAVGDYAVFVTPPTPEPRDPRQGPAPAVKSEIPRKARDMASSGLSAKVKEGTNSFVFEITD